MQRLFKAKLARSILGGTPVLITAAVTLTITMTVWHLVFTAEKRAFEQEFTSRANNQAIILQSGIEDYWDRLIAVQALFASSTQPITRDQFESFSQAMLKGHSAILNIAWIPRVRHIDRAAHERAGQQEGLPDYHIRTIAPDGTLPVAPERDEYFPKFYSTEARTSPVYGLDLRDGGIREATLNRIRDNNVLSISPPLVLHIGEGDRRGFWAGLPVYANGRPHDTVESRRQNFIGIVQGVFQVGVLIETVLASVKTPVRLHVFPPEAKPDDPPIYFTSRFLDEAIPPKSQSQLAAGMHRSFALKLGDIRWTLIAEPEPAGLLSANHARSWIILISGLLLSVGFTAFIAVMRRYAADLKRTRDRFKVQNMQFDAALTNMAQGLLMFDASGRLVITNRRFADMLDLPWDVWRTNAIGKTVLEAMQFVHELTQITETSPTQILSELRSILDSGNTGKVIFERTDGRTFATSCAPMADGGFVVTFEDITEARRNQDQISHLAHYDALTDLPNRVLFYEKMEELLGAAADGIRFAVLSLDLDHFKSVNDTLGHPIGDKLLQAVAERLRKCVRENDVVARLGGDEFAILQTDFDKPADATTLATRLVETVGAPYQIDGHQIVVGASVGIALAPADGTGADQLMKNADLALYRCKADGGSVYRFFEAQMDARMQERRSLELDLRKAVLNGDFALDYQPIVNLKTGAIAICEALIRWQHPVRGIVPPLDFISIAEETGLIVPIGEWVLNHACADAAKWPDHISVAVNVSPGQFKSPSFMQVVKNALSQSGLPAHRLEVEITELVLMQDNEQALAILHELKELGVQIAMDDFGTGYSSLGYLRSFPFDRIKIDQSFIKDLAQDKESLAILRAVVGLGRSLGIVTTAEGVETNKQLEVLRGEGCTDAQGYLFSQPRSGSDLMALFKTNETDAKAVA